MNSIPETDQWLLNGECNKCRRQSYCRKYCTALKREYKRGVQRAVKAALAEKLRMSKGGTDAEN